jgi:DNA-binding PucR family transcriptional regulator
MIRYSDVALLASALQDEVLASSLQRLYLDPLAYERDGGATLRHTLRAYFLACRQVSSTAAVLGVSRQTVAVRLRTIEERIGRSLDGCASEMDTALRMQELNPPLAAPVFA